MTLDPTVIPGLLLLAAELMALAAVGYIVVRVALRQTDEPAALAQGLAVGPALWGITTNFVLFVIPGLAGAAVGWGIVAIAGVALARRSSRRIRPQPRTVAQFAVAALALFWIALAVRQTAGIGDAHTHIGTAASIRAGMFPPELSWSPGIPLRYHFGVDMVAGLLAPPAGPDLAFVLEILGVYFWISLALIMITALKLRGGWLAVIVVAPLLITPGAWTWIGVHLGATSVMPVGPAVPTELSTAGVASLGEAYWPPPPERPPDRGALPDLRSPAFTWAYALALVVLDRAIATRGGSWLPRLTMAALIGFLGLVQTGVVPVALTLWAVIEAIHLVRLRRAGADVGRIAVRSGAALALAVGLLVVGGGVVTSLIGGGSTDGLGLAQSPRLLLGLAFGEYSQAPGGAAVLVQAGPLVLAGIAAVVGRHDRLVSVLALGACMFTLAWIVLDYRPAPFDWDRVAGYGRYFALAALVLALGGGLARLPNRWRLGAAALLALLIVWPAIAQPVRILGMSLASGVDIANATRPTEQASSQASEADSRRFVMPAVSATVADYVRNHTPVGARVFTSGSNSWDMTVHTGRPNASGFVGHFHLVHRVGPEHLDVLNYLEPRAVQRMDIGYVHATDAWVAMLPTRAQSWLADPRFFEQLVRDGSERLYRVRPAFLSLDSPPEPASFEALRRAVPPSATVYFALPPTTYDTLRVASALSHARLVGEADPLYLHLLPPVKWRVDPLTNETPDFVVLPTGAKPWMFQPAARTPIWWHDSVSIYAPTGAAPTIMDAPAPEGPPADDPPVLIQVTDLAVVDGRIEFAAAFTERASEGWTSQDWVVLKGDRSPWAISTEVVRHGNEPTVVKWFAGLLSAGSATTSHTYRFDARVPELSVRNDSGAFVPFATSASKFEPGGYILALRLRHEYRPSQWRDAAIIPVLRTRISESGESTYEILEDVHPGRPLP